MVIITAHNPSLRQLNGLNRKKICLISFILKILMSFVVPIAFCAFRKCLSKTAQSTLQNFKRISLLKYCQNRIRFCYAC